MSGFDLTGRHIGDGSPCYIIGEIAQAHEGSLTLAHALIDVIADAGCDALKVQAHYAEDESNPGERWRVPPRWPQDSSRYDYWKRLEFKSEHWFSLWMHARERGLAFIVSPFSVAAVGRLGDMADAWKIASGEITNEPLLRAVEATGKPAILSFGMATHEEMDRALWHFPIERRGWLQCTSEYPCPPERLGLNMLGGNCLGLSDHSGQIYSGLAAVALGAKVLEVHATLSKRAQGFDTSSSLDPDQLRQLVEGVRFVEAALRNPVEKNAMADMLAPTRDLFMGKHVRKAEHDAKRTASV